MFVGVKEDLHTRDYRSPMAHDGSNGNCSSGKGEWSPVSKHQI